MSNNASASAMVCSVPIEGYSIDHVLAEIDQRQKNHRGPVWVVTANPEILLFARAHRDYAEVIRQADLRSVDGVGLAFLLRLFGYSVTRVTGVELAHRLMKQAVQRGWKVGLIGGKVGAAQAAQRHLEQQHPSLVVCAEHGGAISPDGVDDGTGEEARHRLTFFAPEVLFVAFGHPKQERWTARYLADFPSVKVVVGVVGAIDFWAGTLRRAPAWMQKIGLEWLWRLFQEPRRLRRIFRAVVVFPLVFVVDKIKSFG